VSRDWRAWHRAYDADTPLAQRLVIVQRAIADALDLAPPGPIRVLSMCAGEGRDLLGVLPEHARASDVRGRLVELDPQLAARARAVAPATIDVVCGDAATTDVYAGAVPADLVLVCGVFGNIRDDDIERTIHTLPSLCAPGARVIWTRHRRPPDRTVDIRRWFSAAGFEERAFSGHAEFLFGVGVHQLTRAPDPYAGGVHMFEFVGYDSLS
jgi:hypothetical protein